MPSRRPVAVVVVNMVAVLVVFFAVPVGDRGTSLAILVSLALTLVSMAAVTAIVVREIRAEASGRDDAGLRPLQLVVLFEIVFVAFALVYYSMAVLAPGQMVGIETRLDALYFTATTMATVGYGEIHPEGQFARGVATAHIVFDVVFIATFARLLGLTVARRQSRLADEDG